MMASVTALVVLPNLFRPVRILLQASTKPIPKGAGKSNGLMDLSHGQLHELTPICTPKNVILIYVYVLSDAYVLGIFVIYH